MAELKTRPTRKSAAKYIRELEHPRRREEALVSRSVQVMASMYRCE